MAIYKILKNRQGDEIGVTKTVSEGTDSDGKKTWLKLDIPKNEENRDYQEYLEWAKTNTVDPADGKTWDDIRADRDTRLAATDWSQGSDVPNATKTKWQTYRQDLREIPQKQTDPTNITWPTKPS